MTGYSAIVDIHLEALGRVFKLGKCGGGEIWATEQITLPPCEGVVVVTVDGRPSRHRVRLPDGANGDGEIRVEDLE